MLKKVLGAVLFSSIAITAVTAHSNTPEEAAIEYRNGLYHMVKYHFGPMGAMVKGKAEYNAEEFAKNAQAVATLAPFAMHAYPEGSDMGETRAKSDIWENMDDFKEKQQTFEVESAKLAEMAKGSTELGGDLKAQFGNVGKSCKACHKAYRAK